MDTSRLNYCSAVRVVLDLVESNPDLRLPSCIYPWEVAWHTSSDDSATAKSLIRSVLKAVGGKWDKRVWADYFELSTKVNGVKFTVSCNRVAVCKRVVTGVRQVEVNVPATPAVPAVDAHVKIVEVEDSKWECTPILSDADADALTGERHGNAIGE